jgi:hypothetical protein
MSTTGPGILCHFFLLKLSPKLEGQTNNVVGTKQRFELSKFLGYIIPKIDLLCTLLFVFLEFELLVVVFELFFRSCFESEFECLQSTQFQANHIRLERIPIATVLCS